MRRSLQLLVIVGVIASASINAVGQKTETPAEKARREQLEAAKTANERIERENAAVAQAFTAGNAALAAKNYDLAIAEFNKGIAAAPEHSGLSALYANRSSALRSRGIQEFNASIKASDPASKETFEEAAKKYFRESLASANEALRVFNAHSKPSDAAQAKFHHINKLSILSNRAESYKLLVEKVDKSQADAALNAYKDYWLVEDSEAAKLKSRVGAAKMLADAELYEKAAVEFRAVLASDRANIDALFGLGYALLATQVKANFREALTSLQKFEESAPPSDARRADARSMIDILKTELGV